MFIDSEQHINISAVGGALPEKSVQHVITWLQQYAGIVVQRDQIRFVNTPYDYAVLRQAYNSVDGLLKNGDGILETYVDETSGSIRLGLRVLTDSSELRARFSSAGVPSDMIRFHQGMQSYGQATLNQKVRPTVGGLQIKHLNGGDCSLGFNVLNWNTGINPSTDPKYMWTASHCAFTGMGQILGYKIAQLADTVAVEYEVPPVVSFPNWRCPSAAKSPCQEADVLSSKYDDTVNVAYGNVANVDASKNITGYYNVQGTVRGAIVGATLTKVGQAAGKSTGTLSASCVDVVVTFVGMGNVWELCQARATYSSTTGDSGAPIFIPYAVGNPYTPSIVGIHSNASSTFRYFTPISRIDMVFGSAYYYQ